MKRSMRRLFIGGGEPTVANTKTSLRVGEASSGAEDRGGIHEVILLVVIFDKCIAAYKHFSSCAF